MVSYLVDGDRKMTPPTTEAERLANECLKTNLAAHWRNRDDIINAIQQTLDNARKQGILEAADIAHAHSSYATEERIRVLANKKG